MQCKVSHIPLGVGVFSLVAENIFRKSFISWEWPSPILLPFIVTPTLALKYHLNCSNINILSSATKLDGILKNRDISLLTKVRIVKVMVFSVIMYEWGFPGGSDGKESACNVEDLGSFPGSGRSTGEGNGNPLQCSCLENPMNRGICWATVHGAAVLDMSEWLNTVPYMGVRTGP